MNFLRFFIGACFLSTPVFADTLYIAPLTNPEAESGWDARPIEKFVGTITVLDRDRCEIEFTSGERQSFAAHRVVSAIPESMTPAEEAWMSAWKSKDHAGVLRHLPEAMKSRPPVWRQQWMTAVTADACFRTGRESVGFDFIAQLDRLPLPPMVIAALPIAWKTEQPSSELNSNALKRLTDPSPLVRLIGASQVLAANDVDTAKRTLSELAGQRQHAVVMTYAKILLACSASPAELKENSKDIEAQLERLPIVLQDGPRALLIEEFKSAGLMDQARQLSLTAQYAPSIAQKP
jgi:hypothetical protein